MHDHVVQSNVINEPAIYCEGVNTDSRGFYQRCKILRRHSGVYHYTLPTAEILSGKNARACVSMYMSWLELSWG